MLSILLESDCVKSEEEGRKVCICWLEDLGLIQKGTRDVAPPSKTSTGPTLLKAPVKIEFVQNEKGATESSDQLMHGNTYQVVNIAAIPVDQEEDCVSLHKFLELTHDEDPITRKKALRELCPCHVKRDVEEFWDRIIAMTKDPDATVRYQVLHNLCDGSPTHREDAIVEALEAMHNDEDKYIRRRVHQVLANYRRTGKWNIL